jgi:LuxR family maltose regulon positive regulatory protein
MCEDARRASTLLAPENSCQALCRLIAGVADQLRGNREAARAQFEDGARRAAIAAPQVHALCLAQLALLALEDDDWEGAARMITPARSQVTRYGLARYPTSALVLAVSALVCAKHGRFEDAQEDAREAAELCDRLTELAPWYAIEVQIVLGRTALRLSDVSDARDRLADAERLLARARDGEVLHEWLRAAQEDLQAFTHAASPVPVSLTAAELRILHFLPTHLTFREVAERTCVSTNTVKTQANAVYRKLDAVSRSAAVTRALELGLLDAR